MTEAWDPAGGDYSQSHGWGRSRRSTSSRIRLGAPGGSRVVLAPPATGLARASGSVPTQRGAVQLDCSREAGGLTVSASVPGNVTAWGELPVGGCRVVGDGRFAGVSDGVAVYEIGSGDVRLVPRR